MRYLLALLGVAVAVAGVDKLGGNRGYVRMFRHLGWSDGTMQAIAAVETAGGVLMVPSSTRRLGGAVVAAVSTAVMIREVRQGDVKLAIPRGLILIGGLVASLVPQRR